MQQAKELGQVIRFHRRKAKLSRARLSQLAGVGKTAIFDLENGKETVQLNTLLKVLEALNISLEWQSPLRQSYTKSTTEQL